MEEMEKLKEELFSLLKAEGAVLMGIADLNGIVSGAMKTGVSVAVPVPKAIVRICRLRRQRSIMRRTIL